MSIQVLSEQLASQIAAGEVVERPSSVVKELVENGIDAGATTINIDIRNGGRKSIQVADDGAGIPADEIETAFMRHATSKLQTADDLNAIHTLGFRGEALAAIAAVSQVTIVSRTKGEDAGTRLTLADGLKTGREAVGAPQGTVIAVENLFHNVPARLKFLKSVNTEKRLIDELVTRYALAYPGIRFRLTHNGRITFQTSGSGNVIDVLVAIYGPEIARQLLEIGDSRLETEEDASISKPQSPISISGFVGPPSIHWANRSHIVLFVNGRWIKDPQLAYAVIQAYHTLLPTGRYPLGIIFIELSPADVDVNVHPTKTEVRFRQKTPFGAVQRAVRQTLVADSPIRQMSAWTVGSQFEAMTPGWSGELDQHAFGRREASPQSSLELSWGDEESSHVSPSPALVGGEQLPIMRVVGQVGAAYIITEGPDGLFLIDQHAAHRRILYEQFQTAREQETVKSVPLSAGAAVTLSPPQSELLAGHMGQLTSLGFQVEPFGPHTFMVRGVPAIVANQDGSQVLLALVTELERPSSTSAGDVETDLIRCLCRTAAYRPGRSLSMAEMENLIQQLETCQDPLTDPGGLPTFIYLSVAQLAREFGRI